MSDDNNDTYEEFKDAVNMTASELEKWLDSDESKSVGQKSGGSGESTGHESGRHIVKILRRRQPERLALLADELGPRPDEVATSDTELRC